MVEVEQEYKTKQTSWTVVLILIKIDGYISVILTTV